MTRNGWLTTTSTFLIAFGVGAGLGILFAPKSGQETREDIAGAVKHGMNEALAQERKLARRAQQTFRGAKQTVKSAADAVGQAYREARTSVS